MAGAGGQGAVAGAGARAGKEAWHKGRGRAGMPPRLKIYSRAAAERDQARIIMGAISLKRNYGTASVPRFTTPAPVAWIQGQH